MLLNYMLPNNIDPTLYKELVVTAVFNDLYIPYLHYHKLWFIKDHYKKEIIDYIKQSKHQQKIRKILVQETCCCTAEELLFYLKNIIDGKIFLSDLAVDISKLYFILQIYSKDETEKALQKANDISQEELEQFKMTLEVNKKRENMINDVMHQILTTNKFFKYIQLHEQDIAYLFNSNHMRNVVI